MLESTSHVPRVGTHRWRSLAMPLVSAFMVMVMLVFPGLANANPGASRLSRAALKRLTYAVLGEAEASSATGMEYLEILSRAHPKYAEHWSETLWLMDKRGTLRTSVTREEIVRFVDDAYYNAARRQAGLHGFEVRPNSLDIPDYTRPVDTTAVRGLRANHLQSMKPEHFEVLARVVEGKSATVIAEETNRTVAAVTKDIQRVVRPRLEKIRAEYKLEGFSGAEAFEVTWFAVADESIARGSGMALAGTMLTGWSTYALSKARFLDMDVSSENTIREVFLIKENDELNENERALKEALESSPGS